MYWASHFGPTLGTSPNCKALVSLKTTTRITTRLTLTPKRSFMGGERIPSVLVIVTSGRTITTLKPLRAAGLPFRTPTQRVAITRVDAPLAIPLVPWGTRRSSGQEAFVLRPQAAHFARSTISRAWDQH